MLTGSSWVMPDARHRQRLLPLNQRKPLPLPPCPPSTQHTDSANPAYGVTIQYKNGQLCANGLKRSLELSFICSDDLVNIPNDAEEPVEEVDMCIYQVFLHSAYGCPTGLAPATTTTATRCSLVIFSRSRWTTNKTHTTTRVHNKQSAPLSMATCATTTVCAVTTRTPSRRAASATLAGAELAALSVRKPDNHTATVPSCEARRGEARQDEAHPHCMPFLSEVSVSSGTSATSVVLIIACILLAVIMGSV